MTGHSDVEVTLSSVTHYDHGPNLAEALARLACRVARFYKLQAPTLANAAEQHQGEMVHMVRTHGSCCWEEVGNGSLEDFQSMPEEYELRALYTNPGAQLDTGTNSDKYKAELYDEVWQLARDMGFGNVTDALMKLQGNKSR